MTKHRYLNYKPLYILFGLCLVLFVLLTNSVNVKAEHLYNLPYNVDDYTDLNFALIQGDTLTVIRDAISNSIPNYGVNFDTSNYFVYPYDVDIRYNGVAVYLYCISGAHITTNVTDNFSIVSNRVSLIQDIDKGSCNIMLFLGNDSSVSSYFLGYYNVNQTYDIFGSVSTISTNFGDITTYYPFYIVGDFSDPNDNLVLYFYSDWVPEESTFEELEHMLDITSTISNGIDNSLSDLQNQQGFFDNLISNLKNFFNSLKTWIYGGFSTLMSNIKNFFGPLLRNIQNYLNQFKESFEDFKDRWDHFFEIINVIYNMSLENGEFSLSKLISILLVPDSNDVSHAFEGHSAYDLYYGTIHCSSVFRDFFIAVFSSDYSYIFSLPDVTIGGTTVRGLEFDFSWYLPYKSAVDVFISAFMVLAYIKFLMEFVPNFFHGSGHIGSDLNLIGGEKGIDHSIPY